MLSCKYVKEESHQCFCDDILSSCANSVKLKTIKTIELQVIQEDLFKVQTQTVALLTSLYSLQN